MQKPGKSERWGKNDKMNFMSACTVSVVVNLHSITNEAHRKLLQALKEEYSFVS